MKPVTPSGWMAYALAILVVALDQMSKAWILGRLIPGMSMAAVGPLRFTLVGNKGVSYGLLTSDASWAPLALAAFSLVVVIALMVWARRAAKPILGAALGLVIGGALGNLIDRVHRGVVTDFIDVQSLHFPWVFNLADSAITVGVILLLADSLFRPAGVKS